MSIRKLYDMVAQVYGARVKMVLTEVVNDSNIQYLNPDDDDEPGVQLYVTQVGRNLHNQNKSSFFFFKF